MQSLSDAYGDRDIGCRARAWCVCVVRPACKMRWVLATCKPCPTLRAGRRQCRSSAGTVSYTCSVSPGALHLLRTFFLASLRLAPLSETSAFDVTLLRSRPASRSVQLWAANFRMIVCWPRTDGAVHRRSKNGAVVLALRRSPCRCAARSGPIGSALCCRLKACQAQHCKGEATQGPTAGVFDLDVFVSRFPQVCSLSLSLSLVVRLLSSSCSSCPLLPITLSTSPCARTLVWRRKANGLRSCLRWRPTLATGCWLARTLRQPPPDRLLLHRLSYRLCPGSHLHARFFCPLSLQPDIPPLCTRLLLLCPLPAIYFMRS